MGKEVDKYIKRNGFEQSRLSSLVPRHKLKVTPQKRKGLLGFLFGDPAPMSVPKDEFDEPMHRELRRQEAEAAVELAEEFWRNKKVVCSEEMKSHTIHRLNEEERKRLNHKMQTHKKIEDDFNLLLKEIEDSDLDEGVKQHLVEELWNEKTKTKDQVSKGSLVDKYDFLKG